MSRDGSHPFWVRPVFSLYGQESEDDVMNRDKIAAVLGGDLRQAAVAEQLLTAGLQTHIYGLPPDAIPLGARYFENWRQAITGAETVILPLPAAHDGMRVAMPLMQELPPLSLETLFKALPEGTFLAAGKLEDAAKNRASAQGLFVFDYFESEALQQKNALPTAEGAVFILMKELPWTIAGLPVAVTGFGRVSRALVTLLSAMGARVTVAARKKSALEEARGLGCGTVLLSEPGAMGKLASGYAAIFNTVPTQLFDAAALRLFNQDTLMIDLASAPGGVDADAAVQYGVRVIWALSLPGKYAPRSAGKIIAETVLEKMLEEGIL